MKYQQLPESAGHDCDPPITSVFCLIAFTCAIWPSKSWALAVSVRRVSIGPSMASDDDPRFCKIKEARTSVLEPDASKSIYGNHGQRVVEGQRA